MRAGLAWSVVAAAAVVAGLLFWRFAGESGPSPDDPRVVAAGRALYLEHCAACHGENLEGETPKWRTRKPDGALPAPPHDATGHTWHHDDQLLFGIVKHGMARFAPPDYRTDMPAFVGILTDREIETILAYIKSTWPEDIRARQQAITRQRRQGG